MSDREQILDALVREVPAELRREFPHRADLCVLGTRVGYDVCRYFEIEAKPVVVRTIAFNQRWIDHNEEVGGDLEHPSWEQACEEGAWSLAVDERDRDEPGRYAGHLVLVAPGSPDFLLDLTARQFSRPERRLHLPDAIKQEVDLAAFVDGEPLILGDPEGYIAYRCRDDAPDYRHGHDWRTHQPFSGRIIRRLRAGVTA